MIHCDYQQVQDAHQMDMVEECLGIPKQAALIADKDTLSFVDCYRSPVPQRMTALEAYLEMTTDLPDWVHLYLLQRSRAMRQLGAQVTERFEAKDPQLCRPQPGEPLDFFEVREISDDRLVLVREDPVARLMLSLHFEQRRHEFRRVYAVTSVFAPGVRGKIYLLAFLPTHAKLMKTLLERVENSFAEESAQESEDVSNPNRI